MLGASPKGPQAAFLPQLVVPYLLSPNGLKEHNVYGGDQRETGINSELG